METETVTGEAGDPAEATGGEDAQRRSIDAVDALLDQVEQALARLDDGSYGRCEQCGEPIADERLVELAIARTCGSCAGIHIGTPEPTPVPSAWSVSDPDPDVADDVADDIVEHVADDITDGSAYGNDDFADDPFDH
jgi:hypothetical protein